MITTVLLVLSLYQSADERGLEWLLQADLITPEQAVTLYCARESTGKVMDAFCSCPKTAVEDLHRKLGRTPGS